MPIMITDWVIIMMKLMEPEDSQQEQIILLYSNSQKEPKIDGTNIPIVRIERKPSSNFNGRYGLWSDLVHVRY